MATISSWRKEPPNQVEIAKGIYRDRRNGKKNKHQYNHQHHHQHPPSRPQSISREPAVGPSRRHGNGRADGEEGGGLADSEDVGACDDDEEDIVASQALSTFPGPWVRNIRLRVRDTPESV